MRQESKYSISFKMKNIWCEICNSRIKETVKINGDKFYIMNDLTYKPPFICFEEKYKDYKSTKGVHFISLYKKKISIGKNKKNDIRLLESSIS